MLFSVAVFLKQTLAVTFQVPVLGEPPEFQLKLALQYLLVHHVLVVENLQDHLHLQLQVSNPNAVSTGRSGDLPNIR